MARTSLEDDAVADLQLAVTEACTTSIGTPTRRPRRQRSRRRFLLDDDALSVEVQDWGTGFDAEAQAPDDDRRDHAGVGLMLIRSLTDELTIVSGATGSTITFVAIQLTGLTG